MRKLISRAAACAFIGALAFSPAQPAAALAAVSDIVPVPEHCAVEAYAVGDRRTPDEPVCFGSESEVSQYLDGLTGAATEARAAAATTVIGTVYKDINSGGASLTFWGTSGCAGVTFGFPSLASGWNNSISSARGSNGCWLTLYTATNYGGSRLNCTPYCASIGAWNDNVQSIVFRPTGTFG